jgi:hypothetical protein
VALVDCRVLGLRELGYVYGITLAPLAQLIFIGQSAQSKSPQPARIYTDLLK